jgi:hypothetical protein
VQAEVLRRGGEGDVGCQGGVAEQQRCDVGGPWLQWVYRLGVVVRKEQVPDFVVERIVDGPFPLERVGVSQSP